MKKDTKTILLTMGYTFIGGGLVIFGSNFLKWLAAALSPAGRIATLIVITALLGLFLGLAATERITPIINRLGLRLYPHLKEQGDGAPGR